MKKHIAEDLPARKHPQAQTSAQSKAPEKSKRGSGGGDDKGEKTPEQKIRQAVYDIRYRARRENVPLRTAYSQYMQNSSMAESEKSVVKQKLFGKGGMQAENFEMDMKVSASNAMAKALYKVFVEKKNEVIDENQLKASLEEASNPQTSEGKKYKVRVTDKKSGVTYVRYANREKISQLRAKGLEVEMTEYGTPYEGERTKGEKTAEVLGGGKAKKDYDKDGKVESPAKEYRGSVHNAIQRRKGGVPDGKDTSNVREDFLGEIAATANLPQVDASQQVNPDTNATKIDILPANKKNKVVVNPTNTVLAHTEHSGEVILETGYSKFLRMLQEKKMTKKEKAKEKKLKKKYDPSGMKASMKNQYGEEQGKRVYFATIRKQAMKEESDCESDDAAKMNLKKDEKMDARAVPTALSLAKLGARYRGAKNPIVMSASYDPEGKLVDEARASEKRGMGSPEQPLSYPGRKIQKERGERGGRHQYSGGVEYGGAAAERRRKKSDPHSQEQRLRGLRNYPEKSGKYSEMQRKKRGGDISSRFD